MTGSEGVGSSSLGGRGVREGIELWGGGDWGSKVVAGAAGAAGAGVPVMGECTL